jgi:hypothetical protein
MQELGLFEEQVAVFIVTGVKSFGSKCKVIFDDIERVVQFRLKNLRLEVVYFHLFFGKVKYFFGASIFGSNEFDLLLKICLS